MAGQEKVRWGIISTANIGVGKVIPGIMKSKSSDVVAIASRELGRAQAAAERLGIPRAYGSYEELLADPQIDAVYNPLPNHLHVELSLRAARAGKHVLCEKPIGINAADAERLRTAPAGIHIAEAFMVRHHPQWLRAREIVRSGELGGLRSIRAVFCYFLDDPANVRSKPDMGGGGILDIGCYAVAGARFLFENEPKRVVSLVDRDPAFRTDRLASVIADFGHGRQLSFVCSTQAVPHQSIEVIGTKARVELVVPFNAPADQPAAILVDGGQAMDGRFARREIIPPCDQYAEQAEAFAQLVLGRGETAFGIDDAIANMRALDAIFESERTGAWATV
jgi:predicted dehydrogenase